MSGVFTAEHARHRLANLTGSSSEPLASFVESRYSHLDLARRPTLGHASRLLDLAPYLVVLNTGEDTPSLFIIQLYI